MKEKAQKSIKHLTLLCPSAPAVWLALVELATEYGNGSFSVSRRQIREWCGVAEKTVSNALAALEVCGWIKRRHMSVKRPKGYGRKLIVVNLLAPWRLIRTATQRKTAALEAAVNRSNVLLRPDSNEQFESETASEESEPEEAAALPEVLDLPPASPE